MEVWVIELGEYEGRYIACVATSLAVAFEWLKGNHGLPHGITWDEPKQIYPTCPNIFTVVGHFEVPDRYHEFKKMERQESFDIERYAVVGG